jgi:signal transduction histidine kinase
MGTDDNKLRFRPRARIIRTIGDQLISGPEAAVAELVKNAYDADANEVRITFFPPTSGDRGRILVQDDGHGMTLSDIQDRWMEPATSGKQTNRTSRGGRAVMGSKGIGRFAAAKLGDEMGLSSVSESDGRRTAVLIPSISWDLFTGDTYLSDIAIDYLLQDTEEATGTEIEIRSLSEPWTEAKLRRLYVELRRLMSPLSGAGHAGFRIFLDLSAYTVSEVGFDGASIVNAALPGELDLEETEVGTHEVTPFPLLTSCDYEVEGRFDESGQFIGTMQIRRGAQAPRLIDLRLPVLADEDPCGAVGVRLFIFDREAEALKSNMRQAGLGDMSAADARDVLDRTAGVAIYRDGFRIRPYGDPSNDWLTLDRRRVQNPSRNIGHNQIAGYVTVEGPSESHLEEKSSREGFEENAAYARLRRLINELLVQVVQPRRVDFRVKAGLQATKSASFDEVRQVAELDRIRVLIRRLPENEREAAEKIVNQQSSILFERIDALEERQRVLEAKSSLGSIIAEVVHEGAGPAGFVHRTTGDLQRYFPRLLAGEQKARDEFQEALPLLRSAGLRLADLFRMLKPLSGGRRRGAPELFRPAESIKEARALLKSHDIDFRLAGVREAPEILGHIEDLTTAMVNLLSNSVYWLEQAATEDPWIEIRLVREGAELAIYVEDNGPGVREEFHDNLFEPGFSTKDGGTGLGLNIAREAVARSGGTLGFHADHDGGALFELRFQIGRG